MRRDSFGPHNTFSSSHMLPQATPTQGRLKKQRSLSVPTLVAEMARDSASVFRHAGGTFSTPALTVLCGHPLFASSVHLAGLTWPSLAIQLSVFETQEVHAAQESGVWLRSDEQRRDPCLAHGGSHRTVTQWLLREQRRPECLELVRKKERGRRHAEPAKATQGAPSESEVLQLRRDVGGGGHQMKHYRGRTSVEPSHFNHHAPSCSTGSVEPSHFNHHAPSCSTGSVEPSHFNHHAPSCSTGSVEPSHFNHHAPSCSTGSVEPSHFNHHAPSCSTGSVEPSHFNHHAPSCSTGSVEPSHFNHHAPSCSTGSVEPSHFNHHAPSCSTGSVEPSHFNHHAPSCSTGSVEPSHFNHHAPSCSTGSVEPSHFNHHAPSCSTGSVEPSHFNHHAPSCSTGSVEPSHFNHHAPSCSTGSVEPSHFNHHAPSCSTGSKQLKTKTLTLLRDTTRPKSRKLPYQHVRGKRRGLTAGVTGESMENGSGYSPGKTLDGKDNLLTAISVIVIGTSCDLQAALNPCLSPSDPAGY
ncbi:hypothetical protein TREES_T100003194 [Tupaia chinensis]|uniref:Uncharacterized protein n=1 Tax=Tupaia chinensis TaxID=246437 RepID=L9KJR0_TUPCH|nr:hypothetical protein TREES_T100003194 [Tupaia chinensis]